MRRVDNFATFMCRLYINSWSLSQPPGGLRACPGLYRDSFLPLLSSLLFPSSLLTPFCRVFTIIYLKQTMLLWYIVLQLFPTTICATCHVISPLQYVVYFYISTFRSMCAVPIMAFFFFCSFVISGFPGMLLKYCLILKWFRSPLLLLVYCYYYYY